MILSLLSLAFLLLVLEPLATYLWDSKNLRRFPNATLLSGITDFAYIFQRYRGFRSKEIHQAHLNHPVLRIGPNSLSFSSPEAIRAIYGHNTPCIKGGTYVTAAGAHASLLDSINKEEHARKRRILSHAFATRNLEQWEFKVTDKVQKLVAQFDRICVEGKGEAAVDFRMWSNLFTIEAIADIALSHHLGCLGRGSDLVAIKTKDGREKEVNYIDCLHSGRRATSLLIWTTKCFSALRFVLKRVPGYFQTQWRKGQGFDEMVQHLVRQRIQRHQNGEQLEDLAACLLQDRHEEARNLEIGEVEAEVATLYAGSDTTAISLTHAMYLLLKTPSALSQLREELRDALGDSQETAKYASVKNLPYLQACINESLRLLPPVAFGLNRMTPPEGLTIGEDWIPGGTLVGVPAYTAHRNPVFTNGEEYRPERWLQDGIKEAQGTFIPFSTGARGCIGRNISFIEQTVLLATLVQRYDFTLADADDHWVLDHEEAFNLWPGPMPVTIRRREAC